MMRKNKNQPSTRRPADRGSQNAPAFSYYASRSSSSSNVGRFKEVRKRFKWQLIPSFIALGAIMVSVIYASTLSTTPLIRKSKNTPTTLLQKDGVYAEAAAALLKKSPLNRSKLLIDTKSIEAKLLAQFPELQNIGITVPLTARQPIVTIEATEPRLVLRTTNGVYALNATGKVILKVTSDQQAAALKVPIVQDESGLKLEVGKIALAEKEVGFISELQHQLQAKATPVESYTLPAIANELHVKPQGKGYYIKFNTQGDPRLQVGTYLAIQAKLDASHTTPNAYIDVRVEEKAFVN